MMTKHKKYKASLILFSVISLLFGLIYFSYATIESESKLKRVKVEKAILNDAANGIFNPDVWKYKLFVILDQRIDSIDVDNVSEKLSVWIETYYNKASKEIRNKEVIPDKGSFWDKVKGAFRNTQEKFVINILDSAFPELKEKLIDALKNNDREIKQIIKDEVYGYLKLNIENIESIDINKNNALIKELSKKEKLYKNNYQANIKWFIIIAILGFIILFGLLKILKIEHFRILLGYALIVALSSLAIGVSTTILEINAKISDINFDLMGSTIVFSDQILYYQRKSIIDVAKALLPGSPFVAIMIVLFSVVFPLIKNLVSFLVIFNPALLNKKLVSIIINNISKWSMADVFVVAIFLAYLGYDSLITNQMQQLYQVENLNLMIDPNASQIGTGFWFFLFYVIASIVSSYFLKMLNVKNE
jgi:hypothetical protein